MTNQLKISAVAVFLAIGLSACSSVPEEIDTTPVSSIPEAGPLAQGGGNVAYQQPRQQPVYQAPPPSPNYGASTYVPAPPYNPPKPVPYDDYESTPVANSGSTTGGYAGGRGTNSINNEESYDNYNNYGRPKALPKPDYSGGDTFSASSGGGASGAFAVQVLASGSSSTAQSMKRQMDALGLNAVVDNVGGLYKVRVPFASREEAASNLSRIRSSSGETGAFVTAR